MALAREGGREIPQVNTDAQDLSIQDVSHNAPAFPVGHQGEEGNAPWTSNVTENDVDDDLSASASMSDDDVIPYSTDTGGSQRSQGEDFDDITNVNREWNQQAGLERQGKTLDIAGPRIWLLASSTHCSIPSFMAEH